MAVVLTCYYRPKLGGCCKRYFRAITALLQQGHTIHYLAVSPFPVEHPECHFHRFPWPKKRTENILFWSVFIMLSPLQLLFIGMKYPFSHLFAFDSLYVFLMQPLRMIKRIPLSFFVRGDAVEQHRLKEHGKFIIMAEKYIEAMAMFDVYMYSVSKTLENSVLSRHRYFKPRHLQVLPNEIPEINITAVSPPSVPLRMACVGIFEKRKNQSLIIDCMQYIKAESAQLYLYGTGPAETALKAQVKKLHLQDRVIFSGWVEAEVLWSQIDLLLFPSLLEGAPNALLEAIGYGVVVLASDIPEHREILPDNCLLDLTDKKSWHKFMEMISLKRECVLSHMREEQTRYTRHLRFDWDAEVVKKIIND